jgi:cytochrome c
MKVGLFNVILSVAVVVFFTASHSPKEDAKQRPLDVWAFRSVLDKKPRMLTLALNTDFYVAYDLAHCKLYKVWKGGVSMEGAAYTDKKEIQPTSWGAAYFSDSLQSFQWSAQLNGREVFSRIVHRGYTFKNNQIYLRYALLLTTKDTIFIEERPEFVQDKAGKPGLERLFKTSNVPNGASISLKSADKTILLKANTTTNHTTYFEPLPEQFPPKPIVKFVHAGRSLMDKSDCFTCHKIEENEVGPAFQRIAQKYPNDKKSVEYLVGKIRDGGTGVWGTGVMNSHALLPDSTLRTIVSYIFTLKPKATIVATPAVSTKKTQVVARVNKPGFGMALQGVHPSYDLTTLHSKNFKPRVAAMAFLPDGRLLVTTWDKVGGVYLLDGVATGDSSKVKVKRIALGLAEPLGIEVVNGEIYVLQKQELTKLIDLDGDELIDEYQVVCNSWDVTADFHEFAFGLGLQRRPLLRDSLNGDAPQTRRKTTARPGTNPENQQRRQF